MSIMIAMSFTNPNVLCLTGTGLAEIRTNVQNHIQCLTQNCSLSPSLSLSLSLLAYGIPNTNLDYFFKKKTCGLVSIIDLCGPWQICAKLVINFGHRWVTSYR